MKKRINWLHISDIHFFPRKEWRDSESRDSLLSYLKAAFESQPDLRPHFIFCTGDIAFGETNSAPLAEQYNQAKVFFTSLLAICGNLPRDRLFVVPGNHDVNRKEVNADAQHALTSFSKQSERHSEAMNQRFSERTLEFRDALKRLSDYAAFVHDYLPHQEDQEGRHNYTRKVEIDGVSVCISGFNSAWTASGDEDDRHLWLAATAQFNAATKQNTGSDLRVGLIHHPTDWLNHAEREIAVPRIAAGFDFWLHGHTHNNWITPTSQSITIGAGAVGAEVSAEFGINITSIDLETGSGSSHFHSRLAIGGGWRVHTIPNQAPLGEWIFTLPERLKSPAQSQSQARGLTPGKQSQPRKDRANPLNEDLVAVILKRAMTAALQSFCSLPSLWVPPILSSTAETARNATAAERIEMSDIILSDKNFVIVAPPQYGLTCLSRRLALDAWHAGRGFWVYISTQAVKPNKSSVGGYIQNSLEEVNCSLSDIGCIILDSLSQGDKDGHKLLKIIAELFPHVRIICTYQQNDVLDMSSGALPEVRDFRRIFLWTLPRSGIRQLVASYGVERPLEDEDAVTSRVLLDLEALNLHRTAQNCLTLLKVSEVDFEENPVNRGELIKRILFLLFNVDAIPRYKARPDLKDCEFVLGYFCERMIREGNYRFSRDAFIFRIQEFCRDRLLNVDVHIVFDVLSDNGIISPVGTDFSFKFSYWVLYFAAQRMRHDPSFAAYVLENRRYAHYPEIVEFYAGSDRKREDAIRIITADLQAAVDEVKSVCGFPDTLNPYRIDTWKASSSAENLMREDVAEGVKESNLPAEIKDHYLDQHYDRARPYNQSIPNVLATPAVGSMMRLIRAGARALRNSDYAEPDIKRTLLASILDAWDQITKVVLTVIPALSIEGRAKYEGANFVVLGDFGATPEERAIEILKAVPGNIAHWYQDDIYSSKMSPLLIERLMDASISEISKHELALLIVRKRPPGWEKEMPKYIAQVKKDSFYLLDLYVESRHQYRYAFAPASTLKELGYLIRMIAVKHVTGIKAPGVSAIEKTKLEGDIVPKREDGS